MKMKTSHQVKAWTMHVKMIVFRCLQVARQSQSLIRFPAVKHELIPEGKQEKKKKNTFE
jgi:hypothetical protein